MKKNHAFKRYLFVDPLALIVACLISFLFADVTHQYLNTAKRNLGGSENQTIVCLQSSLESSPEDQPNAWCTQKIDAFFVHQKNNGLLTVTFDIHRYYGIRLSGYFNGLPQPSAWLPSIPIAHRKLII